MRMRRLIVCLVFLCLSVLALACFDTYLFLNQSPMVYPVRMLAVEGFGEYSVNDVAHPGGDAMLMNANFYYGVSERMSVHLGFGSDEKPRDQIALDVVSFSANYNILGRTGDVYTLDGILACTNNPNEKGVSLEVSAPNIIHKREYTIVAHPVLEMVTGDNSDASIGTHFGLFRSFNNRAIFGIGAEYKSGQGGPYFSDRLTEGEAAASFFFGTMIGKNFYIQNEFAKGLANSRDFGFATTFKFLFDFNR